MTGHFTREIWGHDGLIAALDTSHASQGMHLPSAVLIAFPGFRYRMSDIRCQTADVWRLMFDHLARVA